MSLLQNLAGKEGKQGRAAEPIIFCHGLEALIKAGLGDGAELALWPRQPSAGLVAAFEALDCSSFEDLRFTGRPEDVLQPAVAWLTQSSWPALVRQTLLGDVQAAFACIGDIDADCTFRLEHVSDDACRKFHKDDTDFRLITTYFGRGTQWRVERAGEEPGPIHEMKPHEMAMLLGQRCSLENCVLHRSPPIEGSGQARLVLVLDFERPDYC